MKNYNQIIKDIRTRTENEIERTGNRINKYIEVDNISNKIDLTNINKYEIEIVEQLQRKININNQIIATNLTEYLYNKYLYTDNFNKVYSIDNIVYVDLEQSNVEIKVQYQDFYMIIKDKFTDKVFFHNQYKRYNTVCNFIDKELKKPIPQENTNYTQDFNIRLEYDRETDITKVIEKLKETFNVDFVSKDYKNRNNNNNRIYINVKSK